MYAMEQQYYLQVQNTNIIDTNTINTINSIPNNINTNSNSIVVLNQKVRSRYNLTIKNSKVKYSSLTFNSFNYCFI
jgi:hypothetical protein